MWLTQAQSKQHLYVALDMPDFAQIQPHVALLAPYVRGFKVGLELFCAQGPSVVTRLQDMGSAVFLDLKLHDITTTVEKTLKIIRKLQPEFTTIHALGGDEMLRAAASVMAGSATTLLAVTILTSHDEAALTRIGLAPLGGAAAHVKQLATLACASGIQGLVCAPTEAHWVKTHCPKTTIVCPGIRADGTRNNDQKRITSPQAALAAGADILVMGRPILQAEAPLKLLGIHE